MRFPIFAGVLMLTGSVWAQSLPGGLTQEQFRAIPPDVLKNLPADIWTKIPVSTLKALPPDLFKNIPPGLLAKIPPNAASMTPDEAKSYYHSLDPAQQRSLKEAAMQLKSRIESVPGLMEQLKALVKSLRGT